MLSQEDVEHAKEVLKIRQEKIPRKAGYQLPIETGQFVTTKPSLDDSGGTVTLCGIFKNIKRPR